jgi:glycosyltransferase involved in cell wall biosynthesis/peptidoglycan/xylan/chitin deacetylase (PgdA/CDA1 family)
MPQKWLGWPDGKKFAFVLTHDVESKNGLTCLQSLADLETSLGLFSSFNFVGADYPIPSALIDRLNSDQFEIGIHGLHHNGLMYVSKRTFYRHTQGIRQLMKQWNAKGFRSPSMHRNLDWIHALNSEYDASTFDTDPFEPQPDGTGTIFPFWVPHRDNTSGYVELSYTLPQDFTLFIILKEKNIDIWKRKLDWIAKKGGMALLITHPDYMSWDESDRGPEKYPVAYYREFLEYAKSKYDGQYWHALPREVASYYKSFHIHNNNSGLRVSNSIQMNVCMPTYSYYESDNRVKRYAESLVKGGSTVDVFSLNANNDPAFEIMNGVRIHRIQKRKRNEKDKWSYFLKLILFLIRSTKSITLSHLKKRYDLVHVHNVPDFEVFSAIVPKITGSKIILDIHDIVPELFCSKFKNKKKSKWFQILQLVEKLSTSFADHVIVSNAIWGDRIAERSIGRDKCSIMINYPDSSIFNIKNQHKNREREFILYPGSLNQHQGLDVALKAFASIKDLIPKIDFHIYGEGPALNDLIKLSLQLGIQDRVKFKESLPIQQIAQIMACAKCGVVPKKADLFGNEAFSTKVLEFMSLGVPVVLSNTAIDQYYFNSSQVLFFESGNVKSLAEKLLQILTDNTLREKLVSNSLQFVKENTWDAKKHIYFSIVNSLVGESKDRLRIQPDKQQGIEEKVSKAAGA